MSASVDSPVLTVTKVAKFYGSKLVLKNISCSIGAGEVVLVAGPNGAGKSTLMRIMAGLAEPSAGESILHLEPEEVAYLGHATFIYPRLTALENLTFWAGMYGLSVSDEAYVAMLKRVGLELAIHEPAGSFSRGMAQRLNLARVYLVAPKLLFLDEPGTGLDPKSLAILRKEIQGLREAGTSIIWVSHHVLEDMQLADTVLCIANHGIAYHGPAAQFDAGILA